MHAQIKSMRTSMIARWVGWLRPENIVVFVFCCTPFIQHLCKMYGKSSKMKATRLHIQWQNSTTAHTHTHMHGHKLDANEDRTKQARKHVIIVDIYSVFNLKFALLHLMNFKIDKCNTSKASATYDFHVCVCVRLGVFFFFTFDLLLPCYCHCYRITVFVEMHGFYHTLFVFSEMPEIFLHA